MREWVARLIDWLRRDRLDRELADELQFHRRQLERDALHEGAPADRARQVSLRHMGSLTRIKEDARERWSWPLLDHVIQDSRLAIRQTRRAPSLATAIVLTLGLGLGASAAIFTTSVAAFIEPLPYAEADRLVHLWEQRSADGERTPTSFATLLDWRARASGFIGLEGYDESNLTLGLGSEARMVRGAQVTSGFLTLLGVPTSAGRQFRTEEEQAGSAVAIVSERLVRSTVGTAGLGRTITINAAPHTVVGVLPSNFHFALLEDADVFVPLASDEQRRTSRSERSLHVIGRLRPGVPLDDARDELTRLMESLALEHSDEMSGRTVHVLALRDALLRNTKPILRALLVASALLVIVMALNLALLMLTRYVERRPELHLRSALGASRGRLLRQLLVESLIPSVAGAALAMVVARALTQQLIASIPPGVRIGMPYLEHATMDSRTGAVILAMSALLAIAFGLGPALLTIGGTGRSAGDSRTSAGLGERQLRRGLVAAQVALTTVLLVSSGLLVTSFLNLVRRDMGFREPETLVAARVPVSGPRYQAPEAQQQFYEGLLTRVSALPGIRAAAVVDEVPSGGEGGGIVTFAPSDGSVAPVDWPRASLRIVGGDYFSMMGVPLRAGRVFGREDRGDSPPVVVVSAGMARLLAADGDVIGRRLLLGNSGAAPREVVGVVGDVHIGALDADTPPVIYVSHLQRAENRLTLVLRTAVGTTTITRDLRNAVRAIDAGVPVYAVSTIERQLQESRALFSRRLPMLLIGMFAIAALGLTIVALYAVCTHEVVTRYREFGIRVALGGSPFTIRRLVIGNAVAVGLAGMAGGVVAAMLVSRMLQALLFGVTGTDWRVYGGVGLGVLLMVLFASLWPAIRAGAVQPSLVMRAE